MQGTRIERGVNKRSNKLLKERERKMAKIKMMPGIASLSGRVGNYCFRTMRASGRVYMYQVKGRRDKVQSTKEPSEAVIAQRERFGAITKLVRQLRANGCKKTNKQLWKIATEAYDAANK